MKSALTRLVERLVNAEQMDHEAICKAEVVRLRSGDALSWTLILTGLVPLVLQKVELLPVGVGVVALFYLGWRNGLLLDVSRSNALATIFAACAGTLFAVTGDTMVGFATFLIGVCAVLYFKKDLGHEVKRIYLVSFVLFLVFAHLTLEYSFLIILTVMLLAGTMLMLRSHFPEEIRPGRYVAIVRILAWPMVLAVLLAIPIFAVCPRVPVATINLQRPRHVPGFGDRIRFGEMRGSARSDRLCMTIRSAKGHRWRGTVLDEYGKSGWRRTRNAGDYKAAVPGDPVLLMDGLTRTDLDRFESAEVITEPSDTRVYFSPRFPVAIDLDLARVRYDNPRTLLREDEPQARRTRYVVWFGEAPPREGAKDLQMRYLRLPPNVPARVGTEARRIVGDLTDPEAISKRLENYLAETFTYSLDTVTPDGRDPVDHFVFEARTGHCEYFASAMAVMLRTVGVPSRVVLGYNPGTQDAASGTWSILDRNSHAWVEAYLGPVKGWVEYDPTSGNGQPSAPLSLASRLGLTDLALYKSIMGVIRRLDFEWQRYVVSFSSSMQAGMLKEVYEMLEALEMSLRMWWLRQPSGRILRILSIILIGPFLFGPVRRRVWPWVTRLLAALRVLWSVFLNWLRRRSDRDDLPERARFWREVVSLLAVLGLTPRRGETPREFGRRISGDLESAGPALLALIEAYYQVAYRGLTLDPSGLTQVEAHLETMRGHVGLRQKRKSRSTS